MLYHRIVDAVTLATLTRVTAIVSIAQILVQSGSTIGVLGHPWDCQGCHHGSMTLEFETGGQRLTTSGTTLNVQGSPGTEGGRSQTTSWDRGEIEGNKHHIGDNLECSRQSDMCNRRIVDRIFSIAITVL